MIELSRYAGVSVRGLPAAAAFAKGLRGPTSKQPGFSLKLVRPDETHTEGNANSMRRRQGKLGEPPMLVPFFLEPVAEIGVHCGQSHLDWVELTARGGRNERIPFLAPPAVYAVLSQLNVRYGQADSHAGPQPKVLICCPRLCLPVRRLCR